MITRTHDPLRRIDWSCAPEGCQWSSIKVGDVTPSGWYGWIGSNILLLKDTRKGTFVNTLLDDARTFLYQLPAPKSATHDVMLRALHREADSHTKSVEVRLFAVECARNFYLGEWIVSSIEIDGSGHTFARLCRLSTKDEAVRRSYAVETRPKRSRSESRHAAAIEHLLPGWRVTHEPECVAFYDSELVVDGHIREWGGDQYVCDYVAALGSRRVCFESKASMDGLDDSSMVKCRVLRDHSQTRVVALVGHGECMVWHDFGCPTTGVETRGACQDELRRLLLDEVVRCS